MTDREKKMIEIAVLIGYNIGASHGGHAMAIDLATMAIGFDQPEPDPNSDTDPEETQS